MSPAPKQKGDVIVMGIWGMRRTLTILAGIAVLMSAAGQEATWGQGVEVKRITGNYAGALVVALNKSEVLEVDTAFKRVTVGNPEIADVLPLSDRTIYVLGKQIGLTNLAVFTADDRPVAVVDINVTYDVQALKTQLNQLFPRERIEVRASRNALVVGGTVSGEGTMSRILTVANQYAPGRVANMMSVHGSQQVMLHVRFAEVQRNFTRELGIKPQVNALGTGGGLSSGTGPLSFLTGGAAFDPDAFAAALFSFGVAGADVDILVDALEGKGVIKLLSEPSLVALSGDTASFLAGGQFPVSTLQDSGSDSDFLVLSTTFKEFGVGLSFTPTVIDGDLINLNVETEVSAIDTTLSTETGAGEIFGLSTRRANTTVELYDGQSFSIAGLLQDNFRDNISQLPWLGDVPILGGLFRSTDYSRGETELVIIVTVYLVKPANAGQLTTPADNFIEPSEFDLFFWGRTEGVPAKMAAGGPTAAGPMLSAQPDGGVAGAYGHIIQ